MKPFYGIVCYMICNNFSINEISELWGISIKDEDFVLIYYEKELSLLDELEKPEITKQFAQYSLDNDLVLLVNFVARINAKKYLSVMVIDKGKIIGVSDCLSMKEFHSSESQRIYTTTQGKIGIVVGDDIFILESIRSLLINDADWIVFVTPKNCSNKYLEVLSAHRIFNEIDILAYFKDDKYLYKKNFEHSGKIEFNFEKTNFNKNFIKKFIYPSFEY